MSINQIFATIEKHVDVLLNGKELSVRNWSAVRLIHHSQMLADASRTGTKFVVDKNRGKLAATPKGIRRIVDRLKTLISTSPENKIEIRKNAVELEALCAITAQTLTRILAECHYYYIGVPPLGALED